MAKSPSPNSALFQNPTSKNRRVLILPKYLYGNSPDNVAQAQASRDSGLLYENAHNILIKWADLEANGRLNKKETALNANFLNDIFGNALGYLPIDKANPDGSFTLDREFAVPGVGAVDGAIAQFPLTPENPNGGGPTAVIELKGPETDLDLHRSNGRTAVNQLFDYLNALPNTKWGIVSNISTIRLYHKDRGTQAYEQFSLQQLRHEDHFAAFWTLHEKNGLFPNKPLRISARADDLLNKTGERQKEVGDKLYEYYADQRSRLIEHLRDSHQKSLDDAIHIAQMLLDRIVFVAMAGSHGLIPANALDLAAFQIAPYSSITNPRWQNFLDLFRALRTGHQTLNRVSGFSHPMFAYNPELELLQLDDIWALVFAEFSGFDYVNEVPPSFLSAFCKNATESMQFELNVPNIPNDGGNKLKLSV